MEAEGEFNFYLFCSNDILLLAYIHFLMKLLVHISRFSFNTYFYKEFVLLWIEFSSKLV
jgi:hypothetical protein